MGNLSFYTYFSFHFLEPVPLNKITESALFCIEGVYRPPVTWNHDEFIIHAQIYHGTRPLKGSQITNAFPLDSSDFYRRIMFDTWYENN